MSSVDSGSASRAGSKTDSRTGKAGAGTAGKTGTGSELSYEEARAELATVVERLESGGSSLEHSLALWERGEQLAVVCQRWLDNARARLTAER